MENEILSTLNELKTVFYITLSLIVITVIVLTFAGVKFATKFAKTTISDKYKFFAEEMIDKECYEELIKSSKELLEERPNHTYALWYLGKAYFNTEDYNNARVCFEKIAKTNLEWRDNVQPYLDEINGNL